MFSLFDYNIVRISICLHINVAFNIYFKITYTIQTLCNKRWLLVSFTDLWGGQHGPVAKVDYTHAGDLGSNPSAGKKNIYQTG